MPPQLCALPEKPEFIPLLAGLHHAQWQDSHPGWSRPDWEQEFQRHCADFPCTLLALNENHELLGSASLLEDDMDGATAYTPWLANVLVLPQARGAGIGGQLIQAIEEKAQALGYPALHLFTADQQDFYQRRGWQFLQRILFAQKNVVLMRKTLSP